MERKVGKSTAAYALQDLPYQGQTEGLPCMLSSGCTKPSVLLETGPLQTSVQQSYIIFIGYCLLDPPVGAELKGDII